MRSIQRYLMNIRWIQRCLDYLRRTYIHFHKNQCLLRSAALTYITLLTLIPIMVLFFVLFRAFGGLETVASNLETFLFSHLLPDSVVSIKQHIQNMVQGFNSKAVSSVSVLFLIVSAYGLFAAIDTSLNAVWGVTHRRSFFPRLVNLWFILTISPFLLDIRFICRPN